LRYRRRLLPLIVPDDRSSAHASSRVSFVRSQQLYTGTVVNLLGRHPCLDFLCASIKPKCF
jgi:hypothetical protein